MFTIESRFAVLVTALVLSGCGSPHDLGAPDAGPDVLTTDAATEAAPFDAGAEAPPEAALDTDARAICIALGGSCDASADCWCGAGAGCGGLDNVRCSDAGHCELEYPWPDAGTLSCCEACERDFQIGDAGVEEWQTCSNECGVGQCPIRCLAE